MMKGGMGNMMKQAQQMQERMQKNQEELAKTEVIGQSGAGLVKVTMTCSHGVRRVDIDPSLRSFLYLLPSNLGRYQRDAPHGCKSLSL